MDDTPVVLGSLPVTAFPLDRGKLRYLLEVRIEGWSGFGWLWGFGCRGNWRERALTLKMGVGEGEGEDGNWREIGMGMGQGQEQEIIWKWAAAARTRASRAATTITSTLIHTLDADMSPGLNLGKLACVTLLAGLLFTSSVVAQTPVPIHVLTSDLRIDYSDNWGELNTQWPNSVQHPTMGPVWPRE